MTAAARRNVEVLRGWAAAGAAGVGAEEGAEESPARTIRLRFFLRPVELLERDGRVAGVRFARTVPDGSGGVRDSGAYEDIGAQLVLRAVGYRGLPLPGLPFDAVRGTVPQLAGRILRDGVPSPGEYVAGWIKRGPTGVIGSNRSCAKETVGSLLDDAPCSPRARRRPTPWPRCGRGGCAPWNGTAGCPSSGQRRRWAGRWAGDR